MPEDPVHFLRDALDARIRAREPLSPASPAFARKEKTGRPPKPKTPPPSRATSLMPGSAADSALRTFQGQAGSDLSSLCGLLEELCEDDEEEDSGEDSSASPKNGTAVEAQAKIELMGRPRIDSEIDEILARAALDVSVSSPAVEPAPPPVAGAKELKGEDAKDFQL